MTTTPDLLTVAEVAAILRKPAGTLRYWRSKNVGPRSFRVGGNVRYDRAEVEQWIKAQKAATTQGDAS